MRYVLVILLLALAGLTGCAQAELPAEADASLGPDAQTPDVRSQDAAAPDVSELDVATDTALQDAGADVCTPRTCEELAACGSVDDGCGGTLECEACVDPSEIASVTLSPTGAFVLGVGERLDLDAVATTQAGTDVPCNFTWSSQDPTVARVAPTGEVSGVAPGISDVSADCHGKSDRVRVYVNDSGLPQSLTSADELAVWLRADVGLDFSGGASVEGWEDLSGNGFVVANSNFARQPRRISSGAGGHPALSFTGNQELVAADGPVSLEQTTIFVVAKNADAAHRGQLLANCGDGGASHLRFDGAAKTLYVYGEQNGLERQAQLETATTEYRVLSVVLSASQLRVLVDGKEEETVAASTSGSWALGHVGARCSSDYLDGEIAEIMIYRRALSDAERQQVEGYLTGRYSL